MTDLPHVLKAVNYAANLLYDHRLGWLLGQRILRLNHVGSRSGRRYRTVLEVVGHRQTRVLRRLGLRQAVGLAAQPRRRWSGDSHSRTPLPADHRRLSDAEARRVRRLRAAQAADPTTGPPGVVLAAGLALPRHGRRSCPIGPAVAGDRSAPVSGPLTTPRSPGHRPGGDPANRWPDRPGRSMRAPAPPEPGTRRAARPPRARRPVAGRKTSGISATSPKLAASAKPATLIALVDRGTATANASASGRWRACAQM